MHVRQPSQHTINISFRVKKMKLMLIEEHLNFINGSNVVGTIIITTTSLSKTWFSYEIFATIVFHSLQGTC